MRTLFALGIGLFLTALLPQPTFSQAGQASGYDTRWLPISSKEIAQQVRTNARDATSLYQLWWRVRYQYQQPAYFAALKSLKKEQTRNGVVLAVYCAVLMDSNLSYGFGQFKFKVEPHEGEIDNIREELKKAEQLEPKLWLVYTTKAEVTSCLNANRKQASEDAVKWCRKAVELAPNLSFANMKLGYALVNLNMVTHSGLSEAIRCYKKAQRFSPVDAGASFLLLNVYRYYAPDKSEAEKAKQAVLATIPPGITFSPNLRQVMLKVGITLPVGR